MAATEINPANVLSEASIFRRSKMKSTLLSPAKEVQEQEEEQVAEQHEEQDDDDHDDDGKLYFHISKSSPSRFVPFRMYFEYFHLTVN